MVTLNSANFNGMIYPKGLSKNSTCMVEYTQVSNVTYTLPLRSCNTMSASVVRRRMRQNFMTDGRQTDSEGRRREGKRRKSDEKERESEDDEGGCEGQD